MRTEIDYIAFVLAYDLMHDDFAESEHGECDLVYEKCLEIAKDFYKSEFNNPNRDLYSCLEEYVNYLRRRKAEKEYMEWCMKMNAYSEEDYCEEENERREIEDEVRLYMLENEEDEDEYDEEYEEDETENENPLGMLGGFGWGVVFSGDTPEERAQDVENFKAFLKSTGLDKICSVDNINPL